MILRSNSFDFTHIRNRNARNLRRRHGLGSKAVESIPFMNLLKLPSEMQEFLAGLDNPKEIRKYSERRLRNYRSGDLPHKPPPIRKKEVPEPEEESSGKIRTKRKWSPDVIAVEIDEAVSPLNLKVLRKLIQKAALRKLKEHEKDT